MHLHQIAHINLINKGFQFARASRTYIVSNEGRKFLEKPHSIYVLPPSKNDTMCKRLNAKKTAAPGGRHKHCLPKIRKVLKQSNSWFAINKKCDH